MITAETLPRHELNGLQVRVVDADDPGIVGVEGRVVVETTETLHVESRDGRVRQVPKRGSTFEFAVREPEPSATPAPVAGTAGADGTATDDDEVEHVLVEGDRLVARPARRTERGGDSRWR